MPVPPKKGYRPFLIHWQLNIPLMDQLVVVGIAHNQSWRLKVGRSKAMLKKGPSDDIIIPVNRDKTI